MEALEGFSSRRGLDNNSRVVLSNAGTAETGEEMPIRREVATVALSRRFPQERKELKWRLCATFRS
jgi:hypothetical protein